MPIESNDFLPFLDWLLGPNWHEGLLWQPVWLLMATALVVALLALLWSGMRRSSPLSARIAGRLMAAGVLVFGLVSGFVAGSYYLVAWLAMPPPGEKEEVAAMADLRDRVQDAFQSMLATSQNLLGPEWFHGRLYQWLLICGCVMVACIVLGWLICAVRRGPGRAFAAVDKAMAALITDLGLMSPRRVLALAWLAMKEAVRRRVVVVFVVFLVVMLFAGWFTNRTTGSDHPERLYIGNVVYPITMYLTLALALFLSAMSLPADIKNRTLYTIVTKPVRQSEIVLGRILGFAAVGTVLLAVMGVISFIFVKRVLDHSHTLAVAQFEDKTPPGSRQQVKKGETSEASGHQHKVTLRTSGDEVAAEVEPAQGHTHELFVEGTGDSATYSLGPAEGQLQARVPIYGKLHFKNDAGQDVAEGVNVGDEWTYRSFIKGGGKAAAIWDFQGITPDRFPESLYPTDIPLELTIEVFRTYAGRRGVDVPGSLSLRNPDTGLMVEAQIFGAKKFVTDVRRIPRILEVPKKNDKGELVKDALGKQVMETYNLFSDLVTPDGRLEVRLQCIEREQYFGMAQADAYFRARNASFALNFAKGYLGLWMQMVVVLAFGVMFSTFLGAPVAFIATLAVILGGLFSEFMVELATGKALGGGPFEATYRLVTQQNVVTPLESSLPTNTAMLLDQPIKVLMWLISSVLPSLGNFDFSDYVSYGFDVPCALEPWHGMGEGELVMKCLFRVLGFLIPLVAAGYFFLKTREVAR